MKTAKKAGFLKSLIVPAIFGLEAILSPNQAKAQTIHYTSQANKVLVTNNQSWRKSPDFNLDRSVNFPDFVQFAQNFGTPQERYDLDNDGFTGFSDFVAFAKEFGKEVVSVPEVKPIPKQSSDQVQALINPRKVALRDYVTDLFNGDLDFEIVNSHGMVSSLVGPEKDSIYCRPKGTFNSTDNGTAYVTFKVKKEGIEQNVEGRIENEIARNDDALQLSEEVKDRKWGKNSLGFYGPEVYAIYTGNSKNSGDPDILSQGWTGPRPSEKEIQETIDVINSLYDFTLGHFQKNPKIVLTENPNDPILKSNNLLLRYWDNTMLGTGGTGLFPHTGIIEKVFVSTPLNSKKSTVAHETTHLLGFNHPRSEKFNRTNTIFDGSPKGITGELETYSERDRFVVTAYYDN